MSQSDQEKRAWRAPEMVDVGGVLDVTEAVASNVNDGSNLAPVTYRGGRHDQNQEVELEDK